MMLTPELRNLEAEALPLEILRARAEQRIAPAAWAYLMASAGDGRSALRSRLAYERATLLPFLCRNVSGVSTRTTLLGEEIPHPFVVAPMASHRLFHPAGERGTAEGARRTGTPLTLSMESTIAWGEVGAERHWCQISPQRDQSVVEELVRAAEDSGARAIVLTLDTPVPGTRYRQRVAMPTFPDHLERPMMPPGDGSWGAYTWDGLTWDDVERIAGLTSVPVLGKGVLRPTDARRALDAGLAGVIVSNHGGRNFDGLPAPLEQLRGIADAVGDSGLVMVDGGIRSGTDILVALAHGAQAVLIGRPVLWGLGADGADGVETVLSTLRSELEQTMALCGIASIAEIDGTLLGETLMPDPR
ncbi:alpha-hydroxy acid oxidase [Leucobacter sp. GX24907]